MPQSNQLTNPDYFIQLHWQNIHDPNDTQFVSQGGNFTDPDHTFDWIRSEIQRHTPDCPDGFQPMVCDSTSDYFMRAAKDTQ